MSKRPSDKATYIDFFREEAGGLLGFDPIPENGERREPFTPHPTELPPFRVPSVSSAPEPEQKAYWRSLRAFFRTAKGGGLSSREAQQAPYPALLLPYRNSELIQRDFPCWVADIAPEEQGETSIFKRFYPVYELLEWSLDQFAPQQEKAIILKDNLIRLETIIRKKLRYADGIYKAAPVFRESIDDLKTELNIKGAEGETFSENLRQLRRHLPSSGVLLPDSPRAPLYLLGLITQRHLTEQRLSWKNEIDQVVRQLRDILAVEREKSPDSHSPEQLQDAMEFADSFMNFDELSSVLPDDSSETMPAERHQRIEKILSTLEKADDLLFRRELCIVGDAADPDIPNIDWTKNFSRFEFISADTGSICRRASATFDRLMEEAAVFFAALRIGKLETNNQYLPEVHGDLFLHFDWRSFTERELNACPIVLLLSGTSELIEEELIDFSQLLASNRPVKALIWKNRKAGKPEASGRAILFRQELGAMAIAHRNTFVLQSAGRHPRFLNEGFAKGIAAAAPAVFHLLLPPEAETGSSAALWSSAAIEGRAFPGFVFDSLAGPKWGNRFDIRHNPQPDADWPEHSLSVRTQKEQETTWTLSFTYADFAVQDERYGRYFSLVPPQYWNEDLVPLANYLEQAGDEPMTQVPYIWLVDEQFQLQRAAVAWPMVLICQERLDFWHYLQENAGIHSYHVEQATEQLRQQIEADAEARIAALHSKHEEEIERVRDSAARTAMDQLAAILLDLETDASLGSSEAVKPVEKKQTSPESQPPPISENTEALEPEAPPAEEPDATEELSLGEAWIETPLCTSCNECIDMNKNIFQYDANKQAFVADPEGGPFADIVKAAEKCPVAIIHPGAPQNPDEPELEKWIARAEPFQA